MSSTEFKKFLNSADDCKRQGKIKEAITLYKKVVEVNSNYPQRVDVNLGDMLLQQGQVNEALEIYQRAIENRKGVPVGLCERIGDALYRKGKWQEALMFYQKISEKISRKPFWMKIRRTQLILGYEEEAYDSYLNYIQRYYVVNHYHKVIYCAIPKNACTFFKSIMLEFSDTPAEDSQLSRDLHSYVSQNMTLGCREDELKLKDIYQKNDYFCFAVLRNPFSRLVSGYLSKFMGKRPNERYQKIIDEVYQTTRLSNKTQQSITFSQFIHHLARTEDYNLDPHWRPQHTFLGEGQIKFDFVGQLEGMETVAQVLENEVGINIRGKLEKNKTDYKEFNPEEKFHEYYPFQLRKLEQFPKASHFYTPELEAIVRVRYAKDIELYERQFKIPVYP